MPMPLYIDNDLPAINLRFGHSDKIMYFLYHLDSYAAMNTGNLHLHQYLITTYPDVAKEYVLNNDEN